MSVTSGFFNSLNGDRRYNAKQMSSLFDGIINDGVFANIGVAFAVTADSGTTVNVGVGRAWFNSAWVYNDALLPVSFEGSEVVLDRIDALVIEVDHSENVRLGSIKVVKGTPSSSPQRPKIVSETYKNQHPLAYIYRKAGSTEITQADITNAVGTSECPYITGILQTQTIDKNVAQWEAQWNEWYAEKVKEADSETSQWMTDMKAEFDIWFNQLQASLEADVATSLAEQILELQEKFDDLASERAVYDALEDSDGNVIEDSYGTAIEGRTILTSSGGSGAQIQNSKITLYANVDTNWSGDAAPYTKSIAVSGMLPTDDPVVGIILSDDYETVELELESYAYIYRIDTASDSITLYATEPIVTPIQLKMMIVR